jgi:hypothetical protein
MLAYLNKQASISAQLLATQGKQASARDRRQDKKATYACLFKEASIYLCAVRSCLLLHLLSHFLSHLLSGRSQPFYLLLASCAQLRSKTFYLTFYLTFGEIARLGEIEAKSATKVR